MSVETDLAAPAQPSSGVYNVTPLAGDGWHAPQSQAFAEIVSTGDASGGYNRIRYQLEDEHQHMVYLVGLVSAGSSADVQAFVQLRYDVAGARVWQPVTLTHIPELSAAYGTWRVPPLIVPQVPNHGVIGTSPIVAGYVPNSNGNDFTMTCLAYQFRPGARSRTAMPYLVANFAS